MASEHFPLRPIDDFMIHNAPQPTRVMYTSDPRAFERYWFAIFDREGELLIEQGGAVYPNLGTTEAFSIVNLRGRHTTVRAFGLIGDDPLDMRLGPVQATVVQGLRSWQLDLAPNEWGISYDIAWRDRKRAVFGEWPPLVHEGRIHHHNAGFETFGTAEGWIDVMGERIELNPEQHFGARDRHWGIRNMVGGPQHYAEVPVLGIHGQWVEFSDFAIFGPRVLFNLGDERPGAGRIVREEGQVGFDPATKLFERAELLKVLDTGEELEISCRRLGDQIAFLRCGMYGGPQGGTPGSDIWQGMFVGESHVEGETFDVTDPDVKVLLAGIDNHHCVFECNGERTYGIFEPFDPIAYEQVSTGVGSYSLLRS